MWSSPCRRDGEVEKSALRAVTSFLLMVKGKAWFRIKDPPAGEGQVGQIQHCRAVTPTANYFIFHPIFNNNTIKPSYVLNVFCNHNHVIYDSRSTDNYVSIFNKQT